MSPIPKIVSSPASNHCQEGVEGDPVLVGSLCCSHRNKVKSVHKARARPFPRRRLQI